MNKQKCIFVTGTDTDVGKTFFTSALIRTLQKNNKTVVAFKPVAAGCKKIGGELRNEDALALIDAMDESFAYSVINPIALEPAIAPHIAAELLGIEVSVAKLKQVCPIRRYPQDFILVEGAGGWLVPLNSRESFSDYASSELLDVILVVGLKLGCINHALLTQQSILAKGLNLVAWVANHIDPTMENQQQNIETIERLLHCPLMAEIPFIEGDNASIRASEYVNISHLI